MKAGVQRKRNAKLTASVLRVHPRASVMIACPATLQRPDCIEEEVRPLAHGNMAPCFHCLIARCFFVRWVSVGEEVPLPRPRIQVVHGTVPQQCARKTRPARSGLPYRPAIEGLRCHPLPTSSTRAPEVTPN
jgi:hypothetical protein